jgi:hypothetical protein
VHSVAYLHAVSAEVVQMKRKVGVIADNVVEQEDHICMMVNSMYVMCVVVLDVRKSVLDFYDILILCLNYKLFFFQEIINWTTFYKIDFSTNC